MVNTSIRHQGAIAGLLMMAVILLSQVSTAAQKSPQRIRFERGHSSTTVSGRIVGFDAKDYVIWSTSRSGDDSPPQVFDRVNLLCDLLDQRQSD